LWFTVRKFLFQFLLYLGPILLRGILRPRLYNHFIYFSVMARVLFSARFATQVNQLARWFITEGIEIHGVKFATINVHSLLPLQQFNPCWTMRHLGPGQCVGFLLRKFWCMVSVSSPGSEVTSSIPPKWTIDKYY